MGVYSYKTKKGKKWLVAFEKNGRTTYRRGYASRADAMRGELELREAAGCLNCEVISWELVVERYFKYLASQVKAYSVYQRRAQFERYIAPHIKSLDDINKDKLIQFQATIKELPLQCQTANVAIRLLARFIDWLADNDYIPVSLSKYLTLIKNNNPQKNSVDFWTLEEFERFMRGVPLKWQPFFLLLYYSGMRIGEILALKWIDFDFERNEVVVDKALSPLGGTKLTSPKTPSSNRRILLPDWLVKIFEELKAAQATASDSAPAADAFIFGGDMPVSRKYIGRLKSRVCSELKLRPIRIHDFRHSHASLLINSGASPMLVAKRLGHSSVATTLDTYSHMFPNEQELILQHLTPFNFNFLHESCK